MNKIRLLILEDNRFLRDALMTLMQKQLDIQAVAACRNFQDALEKAQRFRPESVLLGLFGPTDTALHILEGLKNTVPTAKVILTGVAPMRADIVEFIKRGVSGFVLRDATGRDFLRTVKSVAAGAKVLPPMMAGSLFAQIANDGPKEVIEQLIEGRMSGRERQVAELIRSGLSNKEIAERLHLSIYTVKSHVHNVLQKLHLRTRLQILAHTPAKLSKPPIDVSSNGDGLFTQRN